MLTTESYRKDKDTYRTYVGKQGLHRIRSSRISSTSHFSSRFQNYHKGIDTDQVIAIIKTKIFNSE